jgi:hypothetical protein
VVEALPANATRAPERPFNAFFVNAFFVNAVFATALLAYFSPACRLLLAYFSTTFRLLLAIAVLTNATA